MLRCRVKKSGRVTDSTPHGLFPRGLITFHNICKHMAYRHVRARPAPGSLSELRDRLDSGEIEAFEPFGRAMKRGLEKARFDPESGEAVWIEKDYCTPPLAMERAKVLDEYFEEITIVDESVDEEAGWERIGELPGLWKSVLNQ